MTQTSKGQRPEAKLKTSSFTWLIIQVKGIWVGFLLRPKCRFCRLIVFGDSESKWSYVTRYLWTAGESNASNCRNRLIDVPAIDLAVNWDLGDINFEELMKCCYSANEVDCSLSDVICSWTSPLLRVFAVSTWLLIHHHPCDANKFTTTLKGH